MKSAFALYYPCDSILHRCDARLKLLALIALLTAVLLVNRWFPMILLCVLTVALILLSKIPLKKVFAQLKSLKFLIIFAFLINLLVSSGETVLFRLGTLRVTLQGIESSALISVRLILLLLNSVLLISLTCTALEMSDALQKLLNPLKLIGVPVDDLAMTMSIALRFVPTLMEEADKIIKAQSSRGANYDTGGILRRASALLSILLPLFISAFHRADDLALAMEARCYRGSSGRTRLREQRIDKEGLILFTIMLLYCTLVIVVQVKGL